MPINIDKLNKTRMDANGITDFILLFIVFNI